MVDVCCRLTWSVCDDSYLHSCEPPVIHGNLATDTIFIQHNGLIKIGSGTSAPTVDVSDLDVSNYNNNNNNNPICKAPECQKTSVALADRNSRAN